MDPAHGSSDPQSYWRCELSAVVTTPGADGVRRLVLGEWHFTTPQGETSERLHGTVLDMLLRSYGKQMLRNRRSRLPPAAQSEVELRFAPIARDATAVPIDALVSSLFSKVQANPLDRPFPDILQQLAIPESTVLETCDLGQVFRQVIAARQRDDHAGASSILSMMLESWRGEPPTDRRVVALAMLLVETAQRGRPVSVAYGDHLLTDMRALEKQSPCAALAAIRNITTEIDGLPACQWRLT